MSPSVVHQLDAAAEDAVVSNSWCDMQALLPSVLTQEDATALLDHCPFMQSTGETPFCIEVAVQSKIDVYYESAA